MYPRLVEQGRRLIRSRSALGYISRFMTVGVFSTAVYFLVSNAFIFSKILSPELGSIAAYLIAMVFSFTAQSRFTFHVSSVNLGQVVRYVLVSGIGLLASYWSVHIAQQTGTNPFWGTLAVSLAIPLISFVAMKFWIFSEAR